MPGKVLIITYYWPPSGGAGVQRWLKFVKYLRKFGWEPVVYTPLNPEYPSTDNTLEADIPENTKVIKNPIWEPYQLYKRITGKAADEKVNASGFISENKKRGALENLSIWIRGNFLIPDPRKFWIKPSVKFLTDWIRNNKIDAVVSTGPPHSMHLIGLGVKKNTGLPWLADFRDPWTNIDFYSELKLTRWADRKHHKLEQLVLEQADEVVVISESMKEDFMKIRKRDYSVITNGYDSSDTDSNATIDTDTKFTIAHIGSMAKTRNPVNLWLALAELKLNKTGFADDLVIKLVGNVDYSVIESLTEAGLTNNVEKINYQPHDAIIKIQKQSRVLLLIINETPNAKVILPGKFFEYMASGRPILCIGPHDGDASKIIRETKAGYVCEPGNKDEIRKTLELLYNSYKLNSDNISASGIIRYSRESLTGDLSTVLDQMTSQE